MKAFEFTLQRMLEFRGQQADSERVCLQRLAAQFKGYEDEQATLRTQNDEARAGVIRHCGIEGQHLGALASFQGHVDRKLKDIDDLKAGLLPQIERQRVIVVESDRKVKLLDRLREQKYREWVAGRDKEIDELAAASYLSRFNAERRAGQSRRYAEGSPVPLAAIDGTPPASSD
jgi:flagellar export protein FliJ